MSKNTPKKLKKPSVKAKSKSRKIHAKLGWSEGGRQIKSSRNIERINDEEKEELNLMEIRIQSLSEITEPGTIVLIDTPLKKDTLFVVSLIDRESVRYPITIDGKKLRSIGRQDDGKIKFITPEEDGCTGDELRIDYHFESDGMSSTLNEDNCNLKQSNIRIITEKHPLYNKNLSNYGRDAHNMMNIFANAWEKSKKGDLENGLNDLLKDIDDIFNEQKSK